MGYWPKTYLEVGAIAFLISAVSMPIGIHLLRRFGVMDHVSDAKIHKKPIPRGGGIIIFIAFLLAVLWPDYRSNAMNGVLIGAFICLVVGALDDFFGGIPGVWKLITLFIVTLVLWRFGVKLNTFSFVPLDILFTLLWIVGVTSAFNGIDNMDGLASGIATIAASVYLFIAIQAYMGAGSDISPTWLQKLTFLFKGKETQLSWFGMLSAGLIGANIGFLIYNFNPAKVFMGDSGSFFLGFMLAALGVMAEWTPNRLISCTIPVLILGVPIFDFAYILIARIIRGETRTLRSIIDHCATDHISHRLAWIGFSQRKSVLFLYLLSLVLGISAILLHHSTSVLESVLALFQCTAILFIVAILMSTATRRHIGCVQEEIRKLNEMEHEPTHEPGTTDDRVVQFSDINRDRRRDS